ncbi:hypothetical protein GCM10010170_010120 [Dactylosporangium salmoneum]|uniref:Transposase n=1 Tax=Dactylosporangium salmoneum TaxID=53361 RepID=A0ABP5SHV2_9ACTN
MCGDSRGTSARRASPVTIFDQLDGPSGADRLRRDVLSSSRPPARPTSCRRTAISCPPGTPASLDRPGRRLRTLAGGHPSEHCGHRHDEGEDATHRCVQDDGAHDLLGEGLPDALKANHPSDQIGHDAGWLNIVMTTGSHMVRFTLRKYH